MFCEQCGKEIPDNSKFCSGCGAKVNPDAAVEDVSEIIAEAVPEPAAEPAPEPEAPLEPEPKSEEAPPPPPPEEKTAPAPQYAAYKSKDNLVKPLSIGAYIGMFILLAIPIVNLIMLLVWSFSDNVNLNKKHFAIAQLILILVAMVLSAVAVILMLRFGIAFYNWRFRW